MSRDHDAMFAKLAAPFKAREVKILKKGGTFDYVTARTIMNRLDEVLGPANWWDDYRVLMDDSVLCELTIRLPDGTLLTKRDAGGAAGMKDQGDDDKSAVSDSLKRAAAKFGVGRYLWKDGAPDFVYRELGLKKSQEPQAIEVDEARELEGQTIELQAEPEQAQLPAPELTGRGAINEAFSAKEEAPEEATRFENKESVKLPGDHPDARGRDRRKWLDVQEDLCKWANAKKAELLEEGYAVGPAEDFNAYQVGRHMLKWAREHEAEGLPPERGASEKTAKITQGQVGSFLIKLYGTDWRDAMRREVKKYCRPKVEEAKPEEASQETPEVFDAGGQLVMAGRGDAYEGDE